MRMCLGKILLQDPDVLLLDEPTNHLDLDAIEWLEDYIKELAIPTVIVSHDREFLDQVEPPQPMQPAPAEPHLLQALITVSLLRFAIKPTV